MSAEMTVRIDKWLWCVRLFKTRSMATEACRCAKVRVNDHIVKPSHPVKEGETCQVKQHHITLVILVKQVLDKRVSAKLVDEYYEDLTPPEEYQKKDEERMMRQGIRPVSYGRPTKKDRRNMDRFKDL